MERSVYALHLPLMENAASDNSKMKRDECDCFSAIDPPVEKTSNVFVFLECD